jgi:hypothetical protein
MRGLLLLRPWRPPQTTTLRRGSAGRNRPAARAKSIPRPGGHTRPRGDHRGPPEPVGFASIPRRWNRCAEAAGDRGHLGVGQSAKRS